MLKKIVQCLAIAMLLFGSSIHILALTSDAPSLILTKPQQEYFSRLQTLRVLTVPNAQPYVYQNRGISIDVLKNLCATADVKLQMIEAGSYEDALIRLENGEAELAAMRMAPHGELNNEIVPYMESPLQTVYHEQARLSEQSSLSIAQLQGIDFYYDEKYDFVDAMTFPTVLDCLDAVRGRQADIFLCDIYQLSVFSESFAVRNLTMSTVPQRKITVGFGLNKNTDPQLASALQSAVDSFATSEMSVSLKQHQQHLESGFRLTQFVYRNPFELLSAVTSLFFVILLCLFVFFRIRVTQHQELRGYEESYRMLANTFGEAGLEYDYISDRLTFFGGRRDHIDLPEVVEQAHLELDQGTLRLSLTSEELDEMLQNNKPDHSYEMELQCGMKEGIWNWFRMIYIVVCTSESHRRPIRLIGCLVNIEEERREKERLMQIGYHDQLTGLLNRTPGENEMVHALSADNLQKVLLFLDIDYFKNFNDRYGHSCGDAVLSTLGTAIREIFSQDDIFCRWGGDEFLLLVKGEGAQPKRLREGLKTLQKRMRSFVYLNNQLSVTLSIGGVVVVPGMPLQSIFELADSALYTVKNEGRDNFHIVTPKPEAEVLCEGENE